jgi:hypothetical protein
MFKCIVAILVMAFGIELASGAQPHFSFWSCDIAAPTGWTELKKKEDAFVLRSPDGHQQATITGIRLGADASVDDFKKLCAKRVEGEKKEFTDGFVNPSEPFKDGGVLGMFFSGGDKKTGRVFSGYLSLVKRELVTVYVEGVGTAPKDHLATFKAFVSGLKRK